LSTSREIVVLHKAGLHARPAAAFVKTANNFASEITVENLTKGTKVANAKSILSLLLAAVQMNDQICICARGGDEEAAISALCDLINSNFGGME
jgi:phosphotransferase system HPr (HPr) family protein